MTLQEALLALSRSTAEAMAGALDALCPGVASHGEPEVASSTDAALAGAPVPGLATSVAYVDGMTGGNLFLLSLEDAHVLAAAMAGAGTDDPVREGELTELERSRIGEAMNQMMAAAAVATSRVLGQEVGVEPPVSLPTDGGGLAERFGGAAHATTTDILIRGRPSRLVQFVPHAFVMRMTRALEQQGLPAPEARPADPVVRHGLAGALRATKVRLSVEVGRARVPVDRLAGVPAGTIIDLDREADEPVDLYVNGRRFALGRLELADGEWAVRLERLLPQDSPGPDLPGR